MENERHKTLQGKVSMILCTAGSRRVLINDKLYIVKRGTLCFASPLINIFELSREEEYAEVSIFDDLIVFYHTIRIMFDTVFKLWLRDHPCMMLDEEHIFFFINRASMVESKKRLLQNSEERDRMLVQQMIYLLEQETLLEFIYLYGRSCVVEPIRSEKNEAIFFHFLYSLNLHYKEHRSVGFYANEVNLSPSHFTRVVKKNTGKTPSDWIATVTIVNAKIMLKDSNMSIKEVAAELHFPEQFTFRKFFKSHVGLPPKAYRLHSKGKDGLC